ncbi:MAG: phage holin family protein [Micrococcales bacterium]|nr:phage holin family protein [Micrococcales bacterium]
MKSIAIKVLVNALALWAATAVITGITLEEGNSSWTEKIGTLLIVAVIFGIVNAVLKPFLKFVSAPLIFLTLGLFTFIVNAAMLQITSWLAGTLNLAFHVEDFFWDAVLGAVVITLVSMVANALLPDDDEL